MIYEKFASYYDQFVDYELNDIYFDMITKYYKEGTAIDIGTGTAPLAIKLAKNNFKYKLYNWGHYTNEYIIENKIVTENYKYRFNPYSKYLKIIDLTGAGDLFASGFLKEYLDKSNIKKCLQTGSKLAAKVIQKIGARLN